MTQSLSTKSAMLLAIVLIASTQCMNASIVFLTSPGQLLSPVSSFYDWDLVGPDGTPVPSGSLFTSTSGLGFTVTEPHNSLSVSSVSGFTLSNSGTDEFLLGPLANTQSGPITLTFATPINGVGASMEWGGFEVATYTLDAYDAANNLLLHSTLHSDSNGDPAFLGVRDTAQEIKSVVFTWDGPSAPHSIGLGDPIFQVAPVPEPATMLLLGAGLLTLGVIRRRRQ